VGLACGGKDDGEWKTTSGSKGKKRRGGKAPTSPKTAVAAISLKQVKPVPPTESRMLVGDGRWSAQGSEEAHSDETQPMNEDDWASSSVGSAADAGPAEEAAPLAAVAETTSELAKQTSRLPATSSRKRAAAAAPSGAAYQSRCAERGVDKTRARALKLSESLALEDSRQAPLLRSSKGVEGTASPSPALSAKLWAASCVDAALQRAPQLQRLVGVSCSAQAFLALLALCVLLAAPRSLLPPALPELSAMHWLEIPLGAYLAYKFNELGGWMQTLCAPSPAPARSA